MMERYREAFEEVTKKHNTLIEEYKKRKECNKESISLLSKSVELMFAIIERHATDVDEQLIHKRKKITLPAPEKLDVFEKEKYLKATTIEAIKKFMSMDFKPVDRSKQSDYSSLLISTISTSGQSEETDKVLLISEEIKKKNEEITNYVAQLIGGSIGKLLEGIDIDKFIADNQNDLAQQNQLEDGQKKKEDKQHEILAPNPQLRIDLFIQLQIACMRITTNCLTRMSSVCTRRRRRFDEVT